jgi:hypothetical protein
VQRLSARALRLDPGPTALPQRTRAAALPRKPGESCLLSGSCLLGHTNYVASGIAETEVELLILPPALFQALIAEDESFRRHVFEVFGERLAALMQVVEAIAYQKLDQRLAALLVARTADSEIHATHQALADDLGSVREIVSRLLRSFEDRGWVDLGRERVRRRSRRAASLPAADRRSTPPAASAPAPRCFAPRRGAAPHPAVAARQTQHRRDRMN